MLRPVVFGTAFAAVVHRSTAPTVSQLVLVGGGEPALFANTFISTALFLGGESDSDLDSLGLQLVKRVAEIVVHGIHERGVVLRSFAVAACALKLDVVPGKVAARREGGARRALELPKKKVVPAEESKVKRS